MFDAHGNIKTEKPVRQFAQIPREEDGDIPLPGVKNAAYKREEEFLEETAVPTQYSQAICWNPRKDEMVNMADPNLERQQFIKGLEDPRRQYLSRYAQIRDILCTQRFRSPEYERKVPPNCIGKTNPMNYGQGASMFNGGQVIQPGQSVRTVMQPDSLSQYNGSSQGPCPQGSAWNPIPARCQQASMLGSQTFN